jgi:hypothetical protein
MDKERKRHKGMKAIGLGYLVLAGLWISVYGISLFYWPQTIFYEVSYVSTYMLINLLLSAYLAINLIMRKQYSERTVTVLLLLASILVLLDIPPILPAIFRKADTLGSYQPWTAILLVFHSLYLFGLYRRKDIVIEATI